MPAPVPEQLSKTIETLYRSESGRVLATLVRLLGDLDLAEEAMHEAFAAALEFWSQTGIPDKPRPWLISTGRFKAIDVIRRRALRWGTERSCCPHGIARAMRRRNRHCDRLAADCCALQPVGANSAFAGCPSQPCRGNCHARWSRGRSGAYRRGAG